MPMRGIILAGGAGSRLWPMTKAVSKQLLPIYDKPLIYYPISTLMLAGIREILIISTPRDLPLFKELLGNGQQLGVSFDFAVQDQPRGLAEAFLIGRRFVGSNQVSLILGDNLFHGVGLGRNLKEDLQPNHARIFGYKVSDPANYGVIEFDDQGNPVTIEEKPNVPKSSYAIPGLYFYDNDVLEIAKEIKPSLRGELEITSINQHYLRCGKLQVRKLERGTAWFDTGTVEDMHSASQYVQAIQLRQGMKIACLEEISWLNGWIEDAQVINAASRYSGSTEYGRYLSQVIASKVI
jgi:glucose-1-phosphate thymidylyltransferase